MTTTPLLISSYDAVLSDLDGVVYAGAGAVPEAVPALRGLHGHGVALAYITNNASRSPEQVAEHLCGLGAPATAGQVFGSAAAGSELLAGLIAPGAPVLVVGSGYLRSCVESRGFRVVDSAADAPAAVIQGFDPTLGWTDLAEAAYAIQRGAAWVATNTDLTIPRAEGIAPGNGSLVDAVANATGAVPLVAGKPEPLLFERAARTLGADRPLVVGDRLDTDILGGNRAGFATASILTGIDGTAEILGAAAAERPRYILGNLAGLYEPYPALEHDAGAHRCGGASARVVDGTVTVAGVEDDLDAWRAACAAWWAATPEAASRTRPDLVFSGASGGSR
ncbi:HAD-IIA family hydrolase [Zafaria sp. Z1313]|uniref:HAD-IIA family hydrolase n=1 Tax=unclassified Zafaria TaxID=2828765 RepID=UPI002E78053E|nr:HAD-IIA family hydrolase [Zafaria sp. J156]MEE1622531.1 HAD-IIA family hydrolase [Zafaria sp. J156]